MKKILIFGSSGMIGHMIYIYFESLGKYKLSSSSLQNKISKNTYLLDIRDNKKVKNYIKTIKPDYVINCAGLLIEESEKSVEDAILINSLFPNILARLGQEFNYKLIQISTDCVFSGQDGNYSETSVQDGYSVYARTKTLGEIDNDRDLTIRTSAIGPELKSDGIGLLNWFLNQKGDILGFKKAYWSGVTTLELARVIDKLINLDITGIYNLTSEEKISKYELLLLFKKIWNKADVIIKVDSDYANDKSLCNLRLDFQYTQKKYETMFMEAYNWMLKNKKRYQHYFDIFQN
jgi:dTDP-4-dehydrorhamnose reductase